jgi:iron complex outermembrane recepter protein
MSLRYAVLAGAAVGAFTVAAPAVHAQQAIEEIVVIGSYIRRAPEDAPSPIRVFGRSELESMGRPQLADAITQLPAVVGSENQTAQEQSVGGAGAANINIRNLGLASTLVLLDGKRLNTGTSTSNQGEQFVDINRLPFIMIENIEILKDGASALYGSDAVAGVANFKLRSNFEGFEIQALYQDSFKGRDSSFDRYDLPEAYRAGIEKLAKDEHNDRDIGAIWGFGNDRTHLVVGFNYFERDPLHSAARQSALNTAILENQAPSPFSFPQDMFAAQQIAPGFEIPGVMMINDASCVALGYYRTRNSGLCSGTADLMQRDIFSQERRKQLLGTWTHQLNDDIELYGHFGGSENRARISQGPSLPLTSQVFFSPNNPGLRFEVENGLMNAFALGDDIPNRLASRIPQIGFYPLPVISFIGGVDPTDPDAVLAAMGTITFNGLARGALAGLQNIVGVPADVNGDGVISPGEIFKYHTHSQIDRETRLFMAGARGDINDDWRFDVSASYSDEKSETAFRDTVNQRVSDALNGYFGPNCNRGTFEDPTRPGDTTRGCTWFNPFGSSMLFPDTVWTDGFGQEHTLGNDAAYVDGLFGYGLTTSESKLSVVDAVFTTQNLFGWALPGGSVGFAVGAQYRKEERRAGGNELTTDPSFPFGFTGPVIPYNASQDIWAIFTELALPVTDRMEVQLALRYEDYGDDTGDTLDPKLALRWQALDELVVRASVGTSFRGPSLSQKFGRGTGLQFIAAPSAEVIAARAPGAAFGGGVFGRSPTFGNEALQPEESTNFNIGVIWSPLDNLTASLDYFNYRYKNVIIPESPTALANDCQIAWHNAGRVTPQLPDGSINPAYLEIEPCNFRNLDGNPATPDVLLNLQGNALNVQRTFVNGTRLWNSGLDLLSRYTHDTSYGTFGVTLDFTWFLEYEINQSVTPFDVRLNPGQKIDMVGLAYTVLVGRPLPEYKGMLMLDWYHGQHYATLNTNYVSELVETEAEVPIRLGSHTTIDGSYTYSFNNVNASLTLGGINLFDRDPPRASGFNSYNSTLHDPRGRMWYLRARYAF